MGNVIKICAALGVGYWLGKNSAKVQEWMIREPGNPR